MYDYFVIKNGLDGSEKLLNKASPFFGEISGKVGPFCMISMLAYPILPYTFTQPPLFKSLSIESQQTDFPMQNNTPKSVPATWRVVTSTNTSASLGNVVYLDHVYLSSLPKLDKQTLNITPSVLSPDALEKVLLNGKRIEINQMQGQVTKF